MLLIANYENNPVAGELSDAIVQFTASQRAAGGTADMLYHHVQEVDPSRWSGQIEQALGNRAALATLKAKRIAAEVCLQCYDLSHQIEMERLNRNRERLTAAVKAASAFRECTPERASTRAILQTVVNNCVMADGVLAKPDPAVPGMNSALAHDSSSVLLCAFSRMASRVEGDDTCEHTDLTIRALHYVNGLVLNPHPATLSWSGDSQVALPIELVSEMPIIAPADGFPSSCPALSGLTARLQVLQQFTRQCRLAHEKAIEESDRLDEQHYAKRLVLALGDDKLSDTGDVTKLLAEHQASRVDCQSARIALEVALQHGFNLSQDAIVTLLQSIAETRVLEREPGNSIGVRRPYALRGTVSLVLRLALANCLAADFLVHKFVQVAKEARKDAGDDQANAAARSALLDAYGRVSKKHRQTSPS